MFKVAKQQCENCLLSQNAIVSPSAVQKHLKKCAAEDTHFICHKATMNGQEICCRAFYDTRSTNLIRVMGRLGCIEFVDLPETQPLMSWREQQERLAKAREAQP